MPKQFIFSIKIPHCSCLCEICENASLLGKELENWSKRVQIPTDPHGTVGTYSCNDESKDCILGNCDASQSRGLSEIGFITESNVSSNSNSDSDAGSDVTIKFYHLHKSESGYLSKMQMTLDISYALDRWQEVMTNLKRNIFNNRQQHSTYVNICGNLGERELPWNVTRYTRFGSALLFEWKTLTSIISSGHKVCINIINITIYQYKVGPV